MVDHIERLRAALANSYAIEGELGRGGMAVVYLARDLKHDRQVALKVLRPELAAVLGAERFLLEIRIAARLSHPNILPLHDSGEADGQLFYTMPYVEGESLRTRLDRERQLPIEDATQMAREVADALSHAHSLGIVHRDIKPENILFQAGHAVVTDFGIARAVSEAGGERLTATGLALGTPAYMSPEQAGGVEAVDARADLYSLGCVLYEVLAGEPPFTGPTAQAILARKSVEATPALAAIRETVPQRLEATVAKALAKAPADRHATAREFLEELEADPSGFAPGTAQRSSIAVLPFKNMSADPENEYFSDGMTEEVINAIAQIPDLRVTARTSAFAFKGQETDIREIGRRLNVETLLEGSVRTAGTRVRVTAQLINVADGYHLWSERFDRELEDVFAIQDEIAGAIATRLESEFARASEDATGSVARPGLAAYDAYLRGRYQRRQWFSGPEALEAALACYQEAIDLDATFALAHSALAEAYTVQAIGFAVRPSRELMPLAREAADRALSLDADLAEAHLARALVSMYHEWDYSSAKSGIDRAIAINPSFVDAHFWAEFYYTYVERSLERAVAANRRAAELDPLDLMVRSRLGQVLSIFGRWDEAIEHLTTVLKLDPDHMVIHLELADAYARKGEFEEAVAHAERALAVSGRTQAVLGVVGVMYSGAGDVAAARGILEELNQRSRDGYVFPFWLALMHASLGDLDSAYQYLAQAQRDRDCNLLYLTAAPRTIGLQDDPRYQQVLREIGLGHLAGG